MDRDRYLNSARNLGAHGLHSGLETLSGFRKFILRGNVVDLAVGVVIGAVFTAVVTGLVNDFFQPLIGLIVNVKSFNDYKVGPNNVFLLGHFIGVLITFLLTAAVVYFFVVLPVTKLQDRFSPHSEPEAPKKRDCPFCLSSVPLQATRCAFCTAQLPPPGTPDAQNAPQQYRS